jgi:hypothetical protein
LYLAGLMREHLIELGAVPVDPRETPSQTVFL